MQAAQRWAFSSRFLIPLLDVQVAKGRTRTLLRPGRTGFFFLLCNRFFFVYVVSFKATPVLYCRCLSYFLFVCLIVYSSLRRCRLGTLGCLLRPKEWPTLPPSVTRGGGRPLFPVLSFASTRTTYLGTELNDVLKTKPKPACKNEISD
jgi:hypothetical protein